MQEKIHKYLGKVNMIIKFKHWFSLLKKGNLKVIYYFVHQIYDWIRGLEYFLIYLLCRPIPLKNKVVASAFNGKKYGDNTKYIVEKIHELNPDTEIVWLKDSSSEYETPEYIRSVICSSDKDIFRRVYEYATAKVWLDTHLYDKYLIKRKGQFVINTWHGGLGIKKIEGDVEKFHENKFQVQKIRKTSKITDVFISNSDFLSNIYRRAFFYKNTIWKTGFPKDDIILKDNTLVRQKVKRWFGLLEQTKIIVYAPTYRGEFEDNGKLNMSAYDIDLDEVVLLFEKIWNTHCVVLVRWHPSMNNVISSRKKQYGKNVIDASSYPEMQEIICASDAFISDYSSCLFEAALREIPCFIYANDYDEYLGDRGAYFALNELPFPYATNNREMIEVMMKYDSEYYLKKWKLFRTEMGLYERGTASIQIAQMVNEFIIKNKNMSIRNNKIKDYIDEYEKID